MGTTTGTSLSDPSRAYTGMGSCSWESGYTQYNSSEYYEVWVYTPYVQSGLQKGTVWAEISNC